MQWDCGIVKSGFVEGYSVDVGGCIHHWLKDHSIRFRHISELAIHHFDDKGGGVFYLEATLNGNYHFGFEYDRASGDTSGYRSYEFGWKQDDLVLPHLPKAYESTLIKKTVGYFEDYILGKQSYPAPTFLGFLEFDSPTPDNRPFIIHSKAGSGYMGFGEEYGKIKLAFIKRSIGL
jgi:hypothetical protein